MKKSNRREIREKVLQVLYAYEFNGEGLTVLTNGILSDVSNENDINFAKQLINKVVGSRKVLDDLIRTRVENWEMERIALIDRILIRIGIAELYFFPEIPPKVSINEVIDIAKDYSTANSGKFINGILDAILSDLKKEGTLNKSGRGLIEESLPKKSIE
ncbi:MAG: transcription antitermination factor NusB [Ignavibacteriae bacterium HGW-Ignavibacteriae-3]|nr:MAG: transcription antitermination factor NusB [Ignavibacteriae bacterium HGW-Ignavibacteriae-3]